ncbi:unnamed protein product [Sympodiomycopsis kandeliae]
MSSNSTLPLSRTSLSPKHQALCRRSGLFNISQVICKSPAELCTILKLPNKEHAEYLLDQLAVECCGNGAIELDAGIGTSEQDENYDDCQNGRDLKGKGRQLDSSKSSLDTFLTTGDSGLDSILGGGLHVGMLTEVVGESSSGKSQLALQTAVYTALGLCPHLNCSSGRLNSSHNDIESSQSSLSSGASSSSKTRRTLHNEARVRNECQCNTSPGNVVLLLSDGNSQGAAYVKRMTDITRTIAREIYSTKSPSSASKKRKAYEDGESRSSSFRNTASNMGTNSVKAEGQECPVGLDTEVADQSEELVAQMLENIQLASIRDLDALDHALQYIVPGFARQLINEPIASEAYKTSQSSSYPSTPLPTSVRPQSQSEASQTSTSRPPLRLIILDSLPALYYATPPTSMNAMVARSRSLCRISDSLKCLASIGQQQDGSGGSAVLVVNHVSDAFDKEIALIRSAYNSNNTAAYSSYGSNSDASQKTRQAPRYHEPPLVFAQQAPFISGLLDSFHCSRLLVSTDGVNSGQDDNFKDVLPSHLQLVPPRSEGFPSLKQASLGQVWNNCINARIMLNKTGAYVKTPATGGGHRGSRQRPSISPLRKASLVFAPYAGPGEIAFVTCHSGIRSLSSDQVKQHLTVPPREEECNEDDENIKQEVGIQSDPGGKTLSEDEEAVWTQFDLDVKGEDLEAVMGEFDS